MSTIKITVLCVISYFPFDMSLLCRISQPCKPKTVIIAPITGWSRVIPIITLRGNYCLHTGVFLCSRGYTHQVPASWICQWKLVSRQLISPYSLINPTVTWLRTHFLWYYLYYERYHKILNFSKDKEILHWTYNAIIVLISLPLVWLQILGVNT